MLRNYLYIIAMAAATFLVRFAPMLLLRKQIKSQFIKSFLYYVPYVTLAVMTFPAIMDDTVSPVVGLSALAVGILAAWKKCSMFVVAILCCLVVLGLDFLFV